ncbi:hypothetical protein [Tabrizicola sp.]|uniref:hypothetical protein n=1 Tax=Tabrizicola sp. TaxID=2005166 RepID=UPI003F2A3F23
MIPIRGPISLLIVAVLSISVAVFVGVTRYRLFESVLPMELIAAMDRMAGKADAAAGEDEPPTKKTFSFGDGAGQYLSDSPDGLLADGPIAALQGNVPTYVDDVITGYSTTVDDDIPAEITAIRPITGCRLTAPQDGTAVGHVTAGRSNLELALSTYSDVELAEAVQLFVNDYRAGGPDKAADTPAPSYQAYDVAVTETRVPVYLVLENRSGNRIWNIHVAEGARVERVVLLGGAEAGVANLDPVVPVEVILGSGLEECGIRPAYTLNSGHELFQSITSGAMSKAEGEAKLAALRDAVTAYDIWFRDSFGVVAGETRAGFDAGTISVVGPVPGEADPKATYAPIQGASLRTTRDTYLEILGQVPEGEDFASRVRAIATTFAFGDLNYLRQGAKF